MRYAINLFLILLIVSSCQNREYVFYECLNEDYRRLLIISEDEFKTKLSQEFNIDDHYDNLKRYLKSVSNAKHKSLIPSEHLMNHFRNGNIINDIWKVDKSINLDGQFVQCIGKSESQFLKDYYSRINSIGDSSPSVIAEGMLEYMETNGGNEYTFVIATVNFYLINLK